MSQPRILSVGQCGFDQRKLAQHFEQTFGARVHTADTFDDAIARLRTEPVELVLVNRQTDADGSLGVDLIRTLKADPALAKLDVMLVSNFADAQADAVGVGALPGFGKSELKDPAVQARLASVLAASS